MEGGHNQGSYNQTMTVSSITFRGILLSKARNHVFFCVLKKRSSTLRLSNCQMLASDTLSDCLELCQKQASDRYL